jgi:uncharacterized Fe-S cluster protein YjdI
MGRGFRRFARSGRDRRISQRPSVDSDDYPPHHSGMRLSFLFLVVGLLVSTVRAEPTPEKASPIKDGNDLQKAVRLALRTYDGEKLKTEQERTDASHARGYLKGLKEASWVLDYANDRVPYILPTNITNEQLAKVILHYLVVHPEKREKASYEVVALALTEAFRNPKWEPLTTNPPKPTQAAGDD